MAAVLAKEIGRIHISDDVIGKIAGRSAVECFGVLGLAAADGLSDLLKRESVDKGVRVRSEENHVTIELSIIAKYGVSLYAVATNIMDSVKYNLENLAGLSVDAVNVIVRGIRL